MIKHNVLLCGTLLGSALMMSTAMAGAYVGGSVGMAEIKESDYATFRDEENSYSLYAGSRISNSLAAEFSYHHLGEHNDTSKVVTATPEVFGVSLKGIIPLSPQFELFVRGGVNHWKLERTIPGVASREDSDLGYSYGAGATLNIAPNLAVTAQVDEFRMTDSDNSIDERIQVPSVGVSLLF